MVRFMIYLMETGLCLSLLYLAYWIFLRKETYFNFIRIFLVGSIALALAAPVWHITWAIPQGSYLEDPARGVLKIRHTYGELIRMIDADFGTEPGAGHRVGGDSETWMTENGRRPLESSHGISNYEDEWSGLSDTSQRHSQLAIPALLFYIYISGVIYFFARFVYLLIRLYLLARKNGVSRQVGFRMVEIKEDISPFSFFRFLFINSKLFNDSELHHVLEHEKAHIRQKHSTDHLFAHALAIFQWFNPFAWQIRKALKTTHEYIADRQVIRRGIERFDYQALLLKQVIGYHTVELVNNFNLKPIKKRIAMMNKNKSGLPARFKAMLVAPFALIIFFLFADFTLKETGNGFPVLVGDLSGLWIKQENDDFSDAIYIRGNSFSFSEGIDIRELHMNVERDALVLSEFEGGPETRLKYQMEGEDLILWWNNIQGSRYVRSAAGNTLDNFLMQTGQEIDLPYISQYRLIEPEESLCRVGFASSGGEGPEVTFNGQVIEMKDLTGMIEKERERIFLLDQPMFTVMFLVDREIPMSEIDKVRYELRKTGLLRIAEGGYPHGDLELSPLIYHAVGLPRLLPPLDAKMLDQKEIEKMGSNLHIIDLSARNKTPGIVDAELRDFIGSNEDGKYVISLEYDGEIPYGQYVETVDMVWKNVYSFRNKLALDRYNVPYIKLGDDLQREIKKAYPMALSESMK